MVVQDADLFLTEPVFSPDGDGVKDETTLAWRATGRVRVVVSNTRGEATRTLVEDGPESGSATWDGRDARGLVAWDGSYTVLLIGEGGRELGRAPGRPRHQPQPDPPRRARAHHGPQPHLRPAHPHPGPGLDGRRGRGPLHREPGQPGLPRGPPPRRPQRRPHLRRSRPLVRLGQLRGRGGRARRARGARAGGWRTGVTWSTWSRGSGARSPGSATRSPGRPTAASSCPTPPSWPATARP